MKNIAALAVDPANHESIKVATSRAVGNCMKRLNPPIISTLLRYQTEHDLAVLDSAPGFAVRMALQKLESAQGLSFSHALASSYVFENGKMTGTYTRLNKLHAIQGLIATTGMPNVAIGFINSKSDVSWAENHCRQVICVDPDENMVARFRQAEVIRT